MIAAEGDLQYRSSNDVWKNKDFLKIQEFFKEYSFMVI